MKKEKGKLGQNARSSGAAPGVEPPAKPSPKRALASGKPKFEPKFTPGPWVTLDGLEGPEDIADAWGEMLATTYPMSFNKGSSVANAYLIATAPELYEALVAVTPSHRAPGCWCGIGRDITGYDHEPSCRMARAALRKARGEKPESTSTEADGGAQAGTRSQK